MATHDQQQRKAENKRRDAEAAQQQHQRGRFSGLRVTLSHYNKQVNERARQSEDGGYQSEAKGRR